MRRQAKYQGAKINPSRFHPSQIKFYLILLPIAIFMTLPVIFTVSQAFKPIDELFRFPPTMIVERPTLNNFYLIGEMMGDAGIPFTRYLINTVIVTILTVGLTILLTSMTAYVFSKKKFMLSSVLFKINMAAMMFVPAAVGIPRYLVIMNVGLNNNFLAHILPYLAMPVGLFLVKQFVDQVPDSLIEAARIDGASEMKVLWGIVFPLITATVLCICNLNSNAPKTMQIIPARDSPIYRFFPKRGGCQ